MVHDCVSFIHAAIKQKEDTFLPGSSAHKQKCCTEYCGGEQPVMSLLCAYRGKYILKREHLWLDATFFERYPHVFVVKTVDSKPWIKLIRN